MRSRRTRFIQEQDMKRPQLRQKIGIRPERLRLRKLVTFFTAA
jgi:hypothetical protein